MDAPGDHWDALAAEVAYSLAFDLQASLEYFDEDAVLMPVDARPDNPTKVDVRKRFLRVFDAERDFVRHVWTVIGPLLDGAAPVVVLFDIDQTLGSRKGRAEESATLVRPAAAPLMGQLREAGVRMGILTTRGITDLRANLDDALHLRRIAPYLDPDHITAAEMSEHADVTVTTTSAEVEPEIFERFRALLAPPYDDLDAFRGFRDDRGRPLPATDLNKLLQLAATVQAHPGVRLVVVDDRDYAALLGGADRPVVGVHLAPHERAHF
jgi:hypothetical protein